MRLIQEQWLALGVGVIIFASCAVCGGCTVLAAVVSSLNDSSQARRPTAAPAFPVVEFAEQDASPTVLPDLPETATPVLVFLSGGLGLVQAEWDVQHRETSLDYTPYGVGYDGVYDVIFQEEKVWYIERQWSPEAAASPEEVEAESALLIPADSQLIETYSPEDRPETIVNLYMSESLKSRFAENWWTGGEPGNFIVLHNMHDFGVSRMVITIGNNP